MQVGDIKEDQLEILCFLYNLYIGDKSGEIDCNVMNMLEELKEFIDVVKPDKSAYYRELIKFYSDKNDEVREYLMTVKAGI